MLEEKIIESMRGNVCFNCVTKMKKNSETKTTLPSSSVTATLTNVYSEDVLLRFVIKW